LAQWRLFYFSPDGNRVETFPLGLGQIGKTTPLGVTRVVRKEANPTWHPPASIRAEKSDLPASVPPGPDNPLGAFAIYLGWKSYLIHGTNKPDGVGRNVSHGCIRLYPEDIERVFREVSVGTPVRTVSQPATAGWVGDRLYLTVYPSKTQTQEIDTEHPVSFDPAGGVRAVARTAAGRYADSVDWRAVGKAAKERTGAPVIVGECSAHTRGSDEAEKNTEGEEGSINGPARRRL
jgi:L,D-transpeptidase ErfK/SrfK